MYDRGNLKLGKCEKEFLVEIYVRGKGKKEEKRRERYHNPRMLR